ncbi:RNA-binding protein 40 [Hordeum vulgare]|nr:RNA-binding protein 40 [Hordeum vulgare]
MKCASISLGRLRKVSHKNVPLVSSVESDDSLKVPFVPNDFADDASNAMSLDCSGEDAEFDKALYNFYVNNKVKYLKKKISCASRRNVKRSSDLPNCSTFTRYSGKFFSGVVDGLCPRYKGVIEDYASISMGRLRKVSHKDVPLVSSVESDDSLKVPFVPNGLCIKKFKDATKVASKRSVTFGGYHYAFVGSYLGHLNVGLHSVPDVKPRILAWRGNRVKQFAELHRNKSCSFGKRTLKRLCAPANLQEHLNVIFIKKCIFIIKGGLPPKDFLLLVPLRVSTLAMSPSAEWHLLAYWSFPLLDKARRRDEAWKRNVGSCRPVNRLVILLALVQVFCSVDLVSGSGFNS